MLALPDQKTLWVPTSRVPRLSHDVAMLQKKALKLGVEPVRLTIGETQPLERKIPEYDFYGKPTGLYRVVIMDHTEITVSGRGPVVPGGFQFLAKLEHVGGGLIESAEGTYTRQEAANIVHVVPGGPPLPARFRTAPPACEHCRTQRDRKDTFVVDAPDGRMVQVGRSCLVDYMGHKDAEHLAELATDISLFFQDLDRDDGEEGEGGAGGGRGGTYLKTLDILASAVDSIREFGFWKSDSLSPAPTWVDASDRLLPPKSTGRKVIYPTEAAKDRAKKIIAWGAQIPRDVKSEYMWNLRSALAEEILHHRTWPLVSSAPIAYARALGEDPRYGTRPTKPKTESEHFGVVGDRTRLKLTLEKSVSLKGAYGDSWIYMFRTEQGDIAVWKSGTRIDDTRPDHDMVCSIGKHDVYQGVKQTVLKRCVPFEEKRELTAEEEARKKLDAAARPWLAVLRKYQGVIGRPSDVAFRVRSYAKKTEQNETRLHIQMRDDGLLQERPSGGSDVYAPTMRVYPTAKGDAELTRAVLELVDTGPKILPVDPSWVSNVLEGHGQAKRDLVDQARDGTITMMDAGRALLAQLRAGDPGSGKKRKKNPSGGSLPEGFSGFDVFEDQGEAPELSPRDQALRDLTQELGNPSMTDASSYFKPGKAPVDRVWLFNTRTGQGATIRTTAFVWTDGDPKAMAKAVRAALIAPSKVPSSVVRLHDWPILVGSPSGTFESPGTSTSAKARG